MKRDDIANNLLNYGYVIIENVLNKFEQEELLEQLNPLIKANKADSDNPFMGDNIIRFGALLKNVPASRKMVMNKIIVEALEDILVPYGPKYQLHYTGVMHVQHGAEAQILHRDISPLPNPSPALVLATMWAATDFTKENGATVFVPESHKWHDFYQPQKKDLRVAEMPKGSVLIYLGNLIHGSGKCISGHRTGVSLQYSVGWMRQEENQYLAVPINLAKEFPEDLQKMMGYDLAAEHWGYVNQQHPLDFLKGNSNRGGLNPKGYELAGKVKALYVNERGYHFGHRYNIALDD